MRGTRRDVSGRRAAGVREDAHYTGLFAITVCT